VSIASLAWTIYYDRRKHTPDPPPDSIGREVRITLREQDMAMPPATERITEWSLPRSPARAAAVASIPRLKSGIYTLPVSPEHGGRAGDPALAFIMGLAAVSARALMAAYGYNVDRVIRVLDAWTNEYAAAAAVGPGRG
jgi:hypothetical protein